MISYFLHHVTWGIWHATDVLHALEFFTEVFFYRFDEVVQVREVVYWVFIQTTFLLLQTFFQVHLIRAFSFFFLLLILWRAANR